MPLSRGSYYLPVDSLQSHLLEDRYIMGGYRVAQNMSELDALLLNDKGIKVGMLVYVLETNKLFQLKGDQAFKPYWNFPEFISGGKQDFYKVENGVWEEAKFGGDIEAVAFPFLIDQGVLKLDASVSIPNNGQPGQMLIPTADGKLKWIDVVAQGLSRSSKSFTSPMTLNQGDTFEFSLDMARTLMLLSTILSVAHVKLEGFSTPAMDDPNPYTFISNLDILEDSGITVDNASEKTFHRRHSFLANKEAVSLSKIYFRLTNTGQSAVVPTVDFTYLVMEA